MFHQYPLVLVFKTTQGLTIEVLTLSMQRKPSRKNSCLPILKPSAIPHWIELRFDQYLWPQTLQTTISYDMAITPSSLKRCYED
jgi:hypothetical protein